MIKEKRDLADEGQSSLVGPPSRRQRLARVFDESDMLYSDAILPEKILGKIRRPRHAAKPRILESNRLDHFRSTDLLSSSRPATERRAMEAARRSSEPNAFTCASSLTEFPVKVIITHACQQSASNSLPQPIETGHIPGIHSSNKG